MSPANDKTKALKYLLIRHAWRFKQNIPDSIYDEITNSLIVKALDKGFLVEWMRNKIEYKKIFNKNEFNFFVRGDKLNNKEDYTIDSITNDNYAKMFVKEAFPNSGKFFSSLELVFGTTNINKTKAHVPLTVIHNGEGEIDINFHLRINQDQWQVVDVDLDEISMRNNLRAQVYKIIAKNNYQELIRRMEEKLNETNS